MEILFLLLVAGFSSVSSSPETGGLYLPVAARDPSSRRYLPVPRGLSALPRRVQPLPGRFQPPPSRAPAINIPSIVEYPPQIQPSVNQVPQYQPSIAETSPYDPPAYQSAAPSPNRRYLPASDGNRGGSRGQKTYLPPVRGGSEAVDDANYDFEYRVEDVKSGNDFGHRESRRGEKVSGRYQVLLPDGRTQVVEYTVDKEGYKPRVSYQGRANAGSGGGYRY